MKKFNIIVLLAIALNITFFDVGFCKSKGKITPGSKVTFSNEPFNMYSDNLKAFIGNSIFDLYSTLCRNDNKYKKNEYETTAGFNERIKSYENDLLYGAIHRNSILAFIVHKYDSEYNADTETLVVKKKLNIINDSVLKSELKAGLLKDGRAIELYTRLKEKKKYTGVNAFGVKKTITAKRFVTWAIALPYMDNIEDISYELSLSMDMKPQTAQVARNYGAILLICKLRPPYCGYGTTSSEPTIDDPIEEYDSIGYVVADPIAAWFYNVRTGDIYFKQPLGNPSIDQPVK